jgi:[glutamine synthetase] adenylyltransferase / [glutamine synthetase]-adenylyl-L-tyrosine phosphorylase
MNKLDRSALPAAICALIEARTAASRTDHPHVWRDIDADERVTNTLSFVWHCSEFVAASCTRDPDLLAELISSGDLFAELDIEALRLQLQVAGASLQDDSELLAALRRFRRRHMVRIAWRDLTGWADTRATLNDLSNLADACIEFAHDRAYQEFTTRHGIPFGVHSGEP